MEFVALVSGGKDSIYAIQQAVSVGHELVACLHMARPIATATGEESYMYQTAASEVVRIQVEQCLQVSYFEYTRKGTSQQTNLVYQQQQKQQESQEEQQHDEVEDLYDALRMVLEEKPEIQAVCSGAILSTYQRLRVEHVVCQRLSLTSLAYLWRASSQRRVLTDMLESGLDAVLVRTAAPPGLIPRIHLNKRLSHLQTHFDNLFRKYQFHVCGEGGEYETLCVDSPLFHKKLVLDQVSIEYDDPNDDTVGNLRIWECHAQDKTDFVPITTRVSPSQTATTAATAVEKPPGNNNHLRSADLPEQTHHQESSLSPGTRIQCLPRVKRLRGGLWHVSELICPPPQFDNPTTRDAVSSMDLAIQEALGIFHMLSQILEQHGCTPHDVVMVHLYLSEMKWFAPINQQYAAFFGSLLPPSRSCIAPATNRGTTTTTTHRVSMDCLVQYQSGINMRRGGFGSNNQVPTRHVLHVQSRSFWAPVCVGPYSQANTVWNALIYLAGQIGLNPSTMTLVRDQTSDNNNDNNDNWKQQLQQTWTNVAQVLDAIDQSSLPNNLLSCLVYIQHGIPKNSTTTTFATTSEIMSAIHGVCRESIGTNGGVIPGLIDTGKAVLGAAEEEEDYQGFEDEETMREVLGLSHESTTTTTAAITEFPCILIVSVAELPVGAEIEVEVVAATRETTRYLQRTLHPLISRTIPSVSSSKNSMWKWDTGHNDWPNDTTNRKFKDQNIIVSSSLSTLGTCCAGYAVVTASVPLVNPGVTVVLPDTDHLLQNMIAVLKLSLSEGCDLRLDQILHIRLYHLISHGGSTEPLRMALSAALGWHRPAVSFVPVYSMELFLPCPPPNPEPSTTVLAMQITLIEPTNLETELWIRCDR